MLLTVEELEKDSKINAQTWRLWIRQGKVPCVRFGHRTVRVELSAYRAFLLENANEKAKQLAAMSAAMREEDKAKQLAAMPEEEA